MDDEDGIRTGPLRRRSVYVCLVVEKGRWRGVELEDRKRHHSAERKRKDKNREGREHKAE